jgi:hypothetical protein
LWPQHLQERRSGAGDLSRGSRSVRRKPFTSA